MFTIWRRVKLAEAERRRKEEAERQAKLDEIAEKQRQREQELEEKERLRRQQILVGEPAVRSSETPTPAKPQVEAVPVAPAAAAASAAPAAGKYVPRHLRGKVPSSGQAPPPVRRGAGGGW